MEDYLKGQMEIEMGVWKIPTDRAWFLSLGIRLEEKKKWFLVSLCVCVCVFLICEVLFFNH